jgi:hypothetical protein
MPLVGEQPSAGTNGNNTGISLLVGSDSHTPAYEF